MQQRKIERVKIFQATNIQHLNESMDSWLEAEGNPKIKKFEHVYAEGVFSYTMVLHVVLEGDGDE